MQASLIMERRAVPALASIGLAFAGTGLLLYLLGGSKKPVAAILGALTLGAILWISGNPRLVALWGFGLALPFDLSKRFGRYIEKMGGESAFRVEVSDVFLVILLFYLCRDLWSGRRAGLYVPKIAAVWVLIFGLGVISLAVGPFRLTVAHELARMLKVLVLFITFANELTTPGRMLHCCGGVLLGSLVQSVVGVIQFVRKKHLGLELLGETGAGTLRQLADESVRTERAFRAGAFMNHPNIFGCFLAIVIPLALVLALGKTSLKYKTFALTCTGMGMAALIATMSRSGWLSCAVSCTVVILVMLLHERSRKRALLAVFAAGAVLLTVASYFSDQILTRLLESKEGAMLSRYEYIDTATRMIKRKPIMGWGLNTYVWNAYQFTTAGPRRSREIYKQWLPPVHNIYYLWTAELGFVGLAAHLLLFGMILYSAFRNLKVRDQVLFAINVACLAGMLAIMVDGIFSFTWRINSIMRIFWVYAALIMAIQQWRYKDALRQKLVQPVGPAQLVLAEGPAV